MSEWKEITNDIVDVLQKPGVYRFDWDGQVECVTVEDSDDTFGVDRYFELLNKCGNVKVYAEA